MLLKQARAHALPDSFMLGNVDLTIGHVKEDMEDIRYDRLAGHQHLESQTSSCPNETTESEGEPCGA